MDLKKFAGGASTLFNRAVQYTGEKLGTAEQTELDAHFEQLVIRSERTRHYTERLLKFTETMLCPDPTVRAENYFYNKLEKSGYENKKKEKLTNATLLGGVMLEASAAYGPGSEYGPNSMVSRVNELALGNSLLKVGQTEQKLGDAEKTFVNKTSQDFLVPLRAFLENDIKNIARERKALEMKRLDLDAAKGKMKKAKNEKAKSESKMSPVQLEAEAEVKQAQLEFDRQTETTKLLLEGISTTHAHHTKCLNEFVEAQASYYASCHQYMQDLQRELGSNNASIVGGGTGPRETSTFASPALLTHTKPTPAKGGFASLRDEPVTQRAKVLYDYEASKSEELSLSADQIITVWSTDDSDWVMAERGGQQGRVPMTYIEIIKQ
ncbi:endophilin-B1-like isoform X2 [Watersipora subatra]|uniref:endophilin-B1-like isoform X2 n=1 Tax=Watersipora subatra TaxID=2589382 RepID=UPI00355BC3D9